MQDTGEQFKRQAEFIPRSTWEGVTVHVVGCGGIGSVAALGLAKIGASRIILYDDDTIELHNVPNQMLTANGDAMGQPKVADLGGILLDFGGEHIDVIAENRRVTTENPLRIEDREGLHLVLCGPDNMETRKEVFEFCCARDDVVGFLDGRMASRFFTLHVVDTNDEAEAKEYLDAFYSTEEAEELPCSDRAVFHTNMVLAAMICEQARRILMHAQEALGTIDPEQVFRETPAVNTKVMFDLTNLTLMVD
jgi:molybdopterin/thiamine biosynthesis adenylyltransferase